MEACLHTQRAKAGSITQCVVKGESLLQWVKRNVCFDVLPQVQPSLAVSNCRIATEGVIITRCSNAPPVVRTLGSPR